MTEKLKLTIFQSIAVVFSIIAFIALMLPCLTREGEETLSILNMTFENGLLIFGFLLLIVGILAAIGLLVLNILNKANDLLTCILGIIAAVGILAGGLLESFAVVISNHFPIAYESFITLNQGVFMFGPGLFVTLISVIVAGVMCYPSAWILLKRMDENDANRKVKKTTDQ